MAQVKRVEIENQILSIGSEFLPAVARKVRDGEDLTAAEQEEYQTWFDSQLESVEEDDEDPAPGAAAMIAKELESICTADALRQFAMDESDNESLRQHESLVRIRLGGDYDASAWDAAMELLRTRTIYSINLTDSERAPAWLSLCTAATPGAQDSGCVRYTVTTDRPEALEAALEADDDVLMYESIGNA